MLELLPLAGTVASDAIIPGMGVPYPWGASAADEVAAFAIWDLGRRWIQAHYDSERREYIDALQSD